MSWDWPQNTAATIATALTRLRGELETRSLELRVLPGAEVALTRAFDLPDRALAGLTLGGGPWLLVEAPHARGVSAVENMLTALAQRGQRIVLAHVERCPAFVDGGELLSRLVGQGMLASVTAGSLTGRFGRHARAAAMRFIASGLVHNVASDAHDRDSRPPELLQALDKAGLRAQTTWLVEQVPQAILRGTPLPPAPTWPGR